MNRKQLSQFLFLLLLTTSVFAQRDTITILHFNDTHSNLAPAGPRDSQLKGTRGGIARMASLIGMTKMQEPNALVLHAGDSFIGDVTFNATFGVAELTAFKALGIDAMTVGNHEFDLTPTMLYMALDTVKPTFPLLSANAVLTDPKVQPLTKYIKPSVIKTVKGHKIGIFGMTTPETNLLSFPGPVFIDTLLGQIAATTVASLKAQGCSTIVLLSHLGLQYDKIVAANIPGIDLIIGGHNHYALTKPVVVNNSQGQPIRIIQAGAFYQAAGKVRLVIDKGLPSFLDYVYIPLDASIPEEPTTAAMVAQLCTGIEQKFNVPFFSQPIGFATGTFRDDADSILSFGNRDTPVGNLVTDAFRAYTKTDIAIQACGSTSQLLPSGMLILSDVFRMIGYGFNTINGLGWRVATFHVTGMELMKGLEIGLANIETGDDFFIQVSGMKYGYDPLKPAFTRLRPELIRIGNKPIEPSRKYSITANEFALGLFSALGISVSDVALRDSVTEFHVVAGYVAQLQQISPVVEGRIVAAATVSVPHSDFYNRPDNFSLRHFPNPVRSVVDFKFTLDRASHATITVFDLIGRKMKTLVDSNFEAGEQHVTISNVRLQSGVYFYSLEAAGKRTLQKMIVK